MRYIIFSLMIVICGFCNAQSGYKRSSSQFSFQQVSNQISGSSASAQQSLLHTPVPKQRQDSLKNKSNFLHALRDDGVDFGILESLEGYYNFMGGIRKGAAAASTFDANISIDTKELLHLPGGKFYVDFEAHSFQNPTTLLVGDLQVFDKNTADPFLQIFEFWYQEEFFHNTLRLKVGKVDANGEFSLIDNGLDFMSSSAHVTPTLFVFPTFPDPKPSVNLFFTSGKLFYVSAAVYAANRSTHFLDFSGKPGSVQPSFNGKLWIAETGLTWSHLSGRADDGNLRLGIWKHTGEFNRTDDNSLAKGAGGIYVVINQTLWKPTHDNETNRGIRTFLEYAHSNKGVAPVYQHFGGGLLWTGMKPGRPDDEIGVCTQYGQISPQPGLIWKYEQALETFYKLTLASWINVQPDVQYIIHPGGTYSNSLVGTLALNLKF